MKSIESMSAEGTKMPEPIRAFAEHANDKGYDIAYTYDTERSRWVFLNPMTADLWRYWQEATRQAMDAKEWQCSECGVSKWKCTCADAARYRVIRDVTSGFLVHHDDGGTYWGPGLDAMADAIRALADVDAKEKGE